MAVMRFLLKIHKKSRIIYLLIILITVDFFGRMCYNIKSRVFYIIGV